jgi:hypothetical protein
MFKLEVTDAKSNESEQIQAPMSIRFITLLVNSLEEIGRKSSMHIEAVFQILKDVCVSCEEAT